MKKIKLIPFLFCLIFLASCHSKLEVEDVLSAIESHSRSYEYEITTSFWTGDKELVEKKNVDKYKELENKELIKLDSVGDLYYMGVYYRILLTDNAKEYIVNIEDNKDVQTAEQKEIDRLLGHEKAKRELVTARVATIRITEIKDIHEIPSENRAQAKIVLEAENKTPFWLLSEDTTTRKEIKINLIKTTEGWRLDD